MTTMYICKNKSDLRKWSIIEDILDIGKYLWKAV